MSEVPETTTPAADAPRKGFWGWIVAGIVGTIAIIGGLAEFTDHLSKLRDFAKESGVGSLFGHTEIDLRDTRKEYHRVDGAILPWRSRTDYEVLVETIPNRSLTKCVADLSTGSRQGSYRARTAEGTEDRHDVTSGKVANYKFYIPMENFPTEAKFRLRCDDGTSPWKSVDWPAAKN